MPDHTPDHWSKAEAYQTSHGGYAAPYEATLAQPQNNSGPPLNEGQTRRTGSSTVSQTAHSRTPPHAPPLSRDECLRELKQRQVRFKVVPALKGVENPIELAGTVGGVAFWASDGRPLQVDCRLALALDELAAVMGEFGVTKVRFSGAYVYRTTRSGRLSHHAWGLAIDLHDFEVNGVVLSVKSDFLRNAGCDGVSSKLNALSCSMRSSALFEEFLTPDFDADHHDHLHLSVPRRTSERAVAQR